MNLFKQQPKTRGYHTIPDALAEDETTAVGYRSSMWMGMRIAFVAGMMLVAGGGTVLLLETMNDGRTTMTIAEGLVVGTEDVYPADTICLPATGTFGGVSNTTPPLSQLGIPGSGTAFQTCYQFGDEANYCWTNSFGRGHHFYYEFSYFYYMCVPGGPFAWYRNHVDPKGAWHPLVDLQRRALCGPPCQDVHTCNNDNCKALHF